MAGDCGSCTACCKLMAVDELSKPRCVWCQHISDDKHSCTVYEDRPEGCRYWECGWLSSQHSDLPLPEDCRPDKSHVVISRSPSGTIWYHCDPGFPDAWRKGTMSTLLNKLVHHREVTVIITIGEKRIIVRKNRLMFHFYEKEKPSPMLPDNDLKESA